VNDAGYGQFYNPERKFGFIHLHPRVPDLFFGGRRVIGEPVKRGDDVELWLADSPIRGRGLVAVEVKRLRPTARTDLVTQ
jgi:cold shock CspA family protein